MAVAFRAFKLVAGASSTTVSFIAPATVVAGDVWVCAFNTRGGTGNTVGSPSTGLTQIGVINDGTTMTLGAFKYTASGSETPSAQFATCSIGATARLYMMTTIAFSGADGTGIGTETGTAVSSATQTDATSATGASDGVAFFGALPSAGTVSAYSANLTGLYTTGNSQGSGQTTCAMAAGYALGAFTAGTVFSDTFSISSAGCAIAIAVPASVTATVTPQLHHVSRARYRAAQF